MSNLTPDQQLKKKAMLDTYARFGKDIDHLDEIPARREYFDKRLEYYRKEAEKNSEVKNGNTK